MSNYVEISSYRQGVKGDLVYAWVYDNGDRDSSQTFDEFEECLDDLKYGNDEVVEIE